MTTINQRIKSAIESKNLTGKKVSFDLEIDYRQFNNWLNNTKPSIEGLQKILIYFPDINARWLLTGEGKMLFTKPYTEEKENHAANLDEYSGNYACNNPGCKAQIDALNKALEAREGELRKTEELLEIYRDKKETKNARSA